MGCQSASSIDYSPCSDHRTLRAVQLFALSAWPRQAYAPQAYCPDAVRRLAPSTRKTMADKEEDGTKVDRGEGIPVAGIGASAGGVTALQAFFRALPNETGAAYVVIVHLDPEHQSDLARILGACTRMPVQEV